MMKSPETSFAFTWISTCNRILSQWYRHVYSRSDRCNRVYYDVQGSRSGRGYYASPSRHESKDRLSKPIPLHRSKDTHRKWHDPFEMNLTRNEIIIGAVTRSLILSHPIIIFNLQTLPQSIIMEIYG